MKKTNKLKTILTALILTVFIAIQSCKKDSVEDQESSNNQNISSFMILPSACDSIDISQSDLISVGSLHNEGLDYLNEHVDTAILYSFTDTSQMVNYINQVTKDYIRSINFQPATDLQNLNLLEDIMNVALDPNEVLNIQFDNQEQLYLARLDSIMDSPEDTILNLTILQDFITDVENDLTLAECTKYTLLSAASVAIFSSIYWHEFAHETVNYSGDDGLGKRLRRLVGRVKAAFVAIRTTVRTFNQAINQGADWVWKKRWKLAKIAKTVWTIAKADAKGQLFGAKIAFKKFGLAAFAAGGPKAAGAIILVGGLTGAVAFSGTSAYLAVKTSSTYGE